MNLLRITLDGEEAPQFTISKSFEKAFDMVQHIWWHRFYNDRKRLNQMVRDELNSGKYDVVFMQLQEGGVIFPETLEGVDIPVFNWTGDVRQDVSYFTPIGKQTITLFSNYTDVEKMRELGFRADYLQTGYDHAHYYETNTHRLNKIVFIANNYHHHTFAQSKLREDMVKYMYKRFPEYFEVWGQNWQNVHPDFRPTRSKDEERQIYNRSLIAINIPHINCSRYYSDRQLRAMACGCLVMSQEYPENEYEFKKGVHFDAWNTFEELGDKCWEHILNRDETMKIGKQAAEYVRNNCLWDHRMAEFKELIAKYSDRGIMIGSSQSIIEKARIYAEQCHNSTNHLYDGSPYYFHLNEVYNQALKFSYLVPEEDRDNFLAAAWVHDVIEDCRQTYNDVLKATNKEVAELAYALTNEKGKSRSERANKKYYDDMKNVPHAVLLKACDRIANFSYSVQAKSRMADMYAKENQSFVEKIYNPKYRDAFFHLLTISADYQNNK